MRRMTRGTVAAALACSAGCATHGSSAQSSAAGGAGGPGVLQDVPAAPSQSDSAPAAPAASVSMSPQPSERVVPMRAVPVRRVSDFEDEAQQNTSRAPDARGLGGACRSSQECQLGLGCADVVFSGAVEPHIGGGYCSRWCQQDSDCTALDAGARCAVNYLGSDLSFCMKSCRTGQPDADDKCGGRADLACNWFASPEDDGSCLPSCNGDGDCAGLGQCSAGTGLCEVVLSSGGALSIGSACAPPKDAACHGACVVTSLLGDAAGVAPSADTKPVLGVCSGSCRLGSTCGEGSGTVCSPLEFGLREGDGGICEQSCRTSQDCRASNTACAPTGFLLPSGEMQRGCTQTYAEPQALAPQRLSVEELQLAGLPSSVLNVSTTSIFQGLSHRLSVEAGSVCVTGSVVGVGGLVYLDFQLAPNNGAPLDAARISGFSFETEGTQIARVEADVVDAPGTFKGFEYETAPSTPGDVESGPQHIGFDQLFDIFAPGTPPLASQAAPQLLALRFSIIRDDSPGPIRFCVKNFAFEPSLARPDAGL